MNSLTYFEQTTQVTETVGRLIDAGSIGIALAAIIVAVLAIAVIGGLVYVLYRILPMFQAVMQSHRDLLDQSRRSSDALAGNSAALTENTVISKQARDHALTAAQKAEAAAKAAEALDKKLTDTDVIIRTGFEDTRGHIDKAMRPLIEIIQNLDKHLAEARDEIDKKAQLLELSHQSTAANFATDVKAKLDELDKSIRKELADVIKVITSEQNKVIPAAKNGAEHQE